MTIEFVTGCMILFLFSLPAIFGNISVIGEKIDLKNRPARIRVTYSMPGHKQYHVDTRWLGRWWKHSGESFDTEEKAMDRLKEADHILCYSSPIERDLDRLQNDIEEFKTRIDE